MNEQGLIYKQALGDSLGDSQPHRQGSPHYHCWGILLCAWKCVHVLFVWQISLLHEEVFLNPGLCLRCSWKIFFPSWVQTSQECEYGEDYSWTINVLLDGGSLLSVFPPVHMGSFVTQITPFTSFVQDCALTWPPVHLISQTFIRIRKLQGEVIWVEGKPILGNELMPSYAGI